MRKTSFIAIAAALVAAPAAADEWPGAGRWKVDEDGAVSCAALGSSEGGRTMAIDLRIDGAINVSIKSLAGGSAGVSLRLNGSAYPMDRPFDPDSANSFLRDFAAGDWLEVRTADGMLDRFSLGGSAASLEQLRLCAAGLDNRLRGEIASGVLALEPPEEADAPDPPPAVRAKARLGHLIRDEDYPKAVLRHGVEGTVAFRLYVRPDGRVGKCAISKTSGSLALDITTCRILTARARFTPARDEAGAAVPDAVHARVVWRIATPPPDATTAPPAPPAPPAPR